MANVQLPNFQLTGDPAVDMNFQILTQIIYQLMAELDAKVDKES